MGQTESIRGMSLRLYLLGQPRIQRDGRPIETDTRKAVALLAYLAVTGAYQSRDALAALLWPEMDDERARAALRRTLSSIRAAVGAETLHATRDGLSLKTERVWCDVAIFQEAVAVVGRHAHSGSPCPDCLPRMESAVDLYRDNFLSGFSLRDSVAFDDWQLAVGEQLRRAYSTALAWLVQAYTQAGDFDRAIERGRRWLAADPLREEVHRRLMQLYAWQGRRDAALRQYRDAVRVLDEELGVGPLPETTALYEAIQEGRLAPPLQPSPPIPAEAPAPPAAEPATEYIPLIGREAAWNALLRIYGAVAASGRLAAITGEVGIGKTYLVDTFLEYARDGGAVTVATTCYEGEAGLAYAPIAAALRALRQRSGAAARLSHVPALWLREAARLVPELETGTPAISPSDASDPGAQARLFAGVSEVLCGLLAGDAPGVFFIDDAHWADDASLELLAYLARRLDDLPVLLIIGWSEAAGDGQRWRRLLARAQRAGTGELIELTRWQPVDVYALVTGREGSPERAAEIADRLYRETEGLPFFVLEYLAALTRAPDGWAIPQTVHDLLVDRLAAVDDAGQQLLQTAAVIGRSFDYTTLWRASGRSEEEVVGGLEELLARGLVRELPTGEAVGGPSVDLRYDFAHQQLRAFVYDGMNLARRRLLHRRVAVALQADGRGAHGSLASLIGDHYRLGGQDGPAADYYRRAGEYARALHANREALGHYRTALALGHTEPAALQEAIGDLHTLLGEYQAALQAYESAAAQTTEDNVGRLEHRIGQVYERRGSWESAESHYCAAMDRYLRAERTADLARLNVDRSRVAYQSGDPAQARALAEEALALAGAAGDSVAEAQAHNTLGILARHDGRPDEARAHLERSLALAEATGTTAARVAALNNLARLLESGDRPDEALALLEQAIALCVEQGDRHREAALYNHRADLYHRAGREEAAMSSLKQAVAIYAEIGVESGGWQPEIWKLVEW